MLLILLSNHVRIGRLHSETCRNLRYPNQSSSTCRSVARVRSGAGNLSNGRRGVKENIAFMQNTGARVLTRVQSSIYAIATTKGVPQAAEAFCPRPSTSSFPFVRSSLHSASSSSHYARLIRPLECRPFTMANVQQYLRVGIRDMSGENTIDIEVFGKAASGTGSPSQVRDDCPFSQRIYLDLEEKHVPYKATYIQEGNDKPDWFLEKNPTGLMPVLRDGEKWIQDSEKIAQYLEEKFPNPSLKTPAEFKNVGSGVFPAFTGWLKTKNPFENAKEKLVNELRGLDDHLKAHGPYIGGEKPTDSDFALIPKLKHLRVALKHFMDFDIPSEFSAAHKYIELLESRKSFKNTDVPDQMIVEGWQKKYQLPDRIVQPQAA